jgi:hypothetical protein
MDSSFEASVAECHAQAVSAAIRSADLGVYRQHNMETLETYLAQTLDDFAVEYPVELPADVTTDLVVPRHDTLEDRKEVHSCVRPKQTKAQRRADKACPTFATT